MYYCIISSGSDKESAVHILAYFMLYVVSLIKLQVPNTNVCKGFVETPDVAQRDYR